MFTIERWSRVDGLRHGFLDAADCTAQPDWRAVVAARGAPREVFLPKQVHGAVVVDAPLDHATWVRPDADAIITTPQKGLAGILTADCVPVLLLDENARAAAAVHAGWRGAAAGVIENTVQHLRAEHGIAEHELRAAIGPAIGPCCYEVGREVHEAFIGRTGSVTEPAWESRGDRFHLDLRAAVRLLLMRAGIDAVETTGPCTKCHPGLHSFRRDQTSAGRQLSFIGWTSPARPHS